MTEHQSSRTLVKSAPELWAECSDAASLARHLGAFGEIRITKLEPETTVAWEGTAASGTVKLETSGWGTRVTLTVKEDPAPPEPAPEAAEPEPEPEATAPDLAPRPGMFARFRLAFRRRPKAIEREPVIEMAPEPETEPVADAPPMPEPAAEAPPEPAAEAPPPPEPAAEPEPSPLTGETALTAALESLGMAHHRPYSRA
jgi:hypothetical protein